MRWRGAKVFISTCVANTAVSSSSSMENRGTLFSTSGLQVIWFGSVFGLVSDVIAQNCVRHSLRGHGECPESVSTTRCVRRCGLASSRPATRPRHGSPIRIVTATAIAGSACVCQSSAGLDAEDQLHRVVMLQTENAGVYTCPRRPLCLHES